MNVGDQVLVLLPIPGHPLQAKYSGPYTIEKKINDVDYVVGTPDKRKEKQLCHINMINLYQARDHEPLGTLCNAVCTVTAGNKEVIEIRPRLSNSKILANPQEKLAHLSYDKRRDLEGLLIEFKHLFLDVPGCTDCVYHNVDVGTATPYE